MQRETLNYFKKRIWLDVCHKPLIINSFDRLLHYKLEGGYVNVISFSKELMSFELLYKKITLGNSKGILTHKQVMCKESWTFVKKLVTDYYDATER